MGARGASPSRARSGTSPHFVPGRKDRLAPSDDLREPPPRREKAARRDGKAGELPGSNTRQRLARVGRGVGRQPARAGRGTQVTQGSTRVANRANANPGSSNRRVRLSGAKGGGRSPPRRRRAARKRTERPAVSVFINGSADRAARRRSVSRTAPSPGPDRDPEDLCRPNPVDLTSDRTTDHFLDPHGPLHGGPWVQQPSPPFVGSPRLARGGPEPANSLAANTGRIIC